jgi:uncharacterized membrane protein YhaH (DUF805 family)
MLGLLFGLNTRIGRLHFFFSTIVLAVVMTAISFGIAMSAYPGAQTPLSLAEIRWPLIVVAVLFGLITVTLQSMRIRDIGWDPVCVIPGWFALLIIDGLVATKFPAWSIGSDHHATAVGALVNLGLMLALTFCPSDEFESPTPTFGGASIPSTPSRGRAATSLTADRIARVAGGQFGRR